MPWYGGEVTINLLPPVTPGGPTLIAAAARTHGLCNEPEGSLWALWQVAPPLRPGGPAVLLPRNHPKSGLYLVPTGTTDLNGDGIPELLYQDLRDRNESNAAGQPAMQDFGIIRRGSRFYDRAEGLRVSTPVCPC